MSVGDVGDGRAGWGCGRPACGVTARAERRQRASADCAAPLHARALGAGRRQTGPCGALRGCWLLSTARFTKGFLVPAPLFPAACFSTACAIAVLAAASGASTASAHGTSREHEPAAAASGLPRLYSGIAKRGGDYVDVFKVRPRTVSVSCADAGGLVISWRRWTSRSASGVGRTRPCREASVRIRVKASRPVDGYFTRLTVRYAGYGTGRLGLGRQGGSITWIQVDWMFDPDSGASPWPS